MNTPPELQRQADALVRRAHLARWAGSTARLTAVAFALAGALILVLRGAFDLEPAPAAAGLGLAALAPLAAYLLGRTSPLSRAQAVARLDADSGGGGALLSSFELAEAGALERVEPGTGADFASRAEQQLAAIGELPRLNWRRLSWPWPGALAFALLCLAVPMDGLTQAGATGTAAALEDRVEDLRVQLDALRENIELEPAEEATLQDRLKRLDEELADAGFQEAFEGIDRLSEDLDRLGDEAQANAEQAMQKMQAAAEQMAQSPSASSAQVSEALEQLAKAGLEMTLPAGLEEQFAELAESLAEGLDGADGVETPESALELAQQLAELSQLSNELSDALSEALSKLGESGLEGAQGNLPEVAWSPELLENLAQALKDAQLSSQECELARGGGT
ncbi:MAG: hypothetical protein ACYS26_04090 [Planctomycetota bacterium]|jgi:hypothetical protein